MTKDPLTEASERWAEWASGRMPPPMPHEYGCPYRGSEGSSAGCPCHAIMRAHFWIFAAVVARLGGEVLLTADEVVRVKTGRLEISDDLESWQLRVRIVPEDGKGRE